MHRADGQARDGGNREKGGEDGEGEGGGETGSPVAVPEPFRHGLLDAGPGGRAAHAKLSGWIPRARSSTA